MGSFSKVTNYLRDVLLQDTNPTMRPKDEVAELLQEDIPGMEISHQDEPGFEVVTKVRFVCAFYFKFFFFFFNIYIYLFVYLFVCLFVCLFKKKKLNYIFIYLMIYLTHFY